MFIDEISDYGYSKRYTVYDKINGRIVMNTDSFCDASRYIRKHSHKTCSKYVMYDKRLRTCDAGKIREAAEK
ncbi:MAG: hypothetical protein Q4E74_01660 [Ruminococcus sp.]|nr:hypothetical protein [Ruminococcus sp.]